MVTSDLGSAEDAVRALLEYLVDPLLPSKSSTRCTPSLSQQESVAKQVHAVVLLYNYYHRKQHQQLEFLGFESFCKLAVVLKPSLLSHMKLMQISKTSELDDLENHLSATEKGVMDACDVCTSLNASIDVPNTEGWPISKVAVFLVDSRKANCVLLFSSITQGVWAVIEKDVDAGNHSLEDAKQISRKKRTTKKSARDETGCDEAGLQQLAFFAVKEATGISQADLMVLESHVVYSLSKEKTASRFYIMQCTQSINEDIGQIPINEVIESLQGPLVKKSSCSWTVTSVIEYFHVLPYKGILSDWHSRGVFSNSLQDLRVGLGSEKLNSTQRTVEPLDAICNKNSDESHSNCGRVDVLVNENVKDDPCEVCPQNEVDAEVNRRQVGSDRYFSTEDVLGNNSSGTDTESPGRKYCNNESRSKNLLNSVEINLHQKETTPFTARNLNAAATDAMVNGSDTESPRQKYINNESRSMNLLNSVKINLHQKETTPFTARKRNAAAAGAVVNGTDTESPKQQYSNNESRSKNLLNSAEIDLHEKETTPFTDRKRIAAATGAVVNGTDTESPRQEYSNNESRSKNLLNSAEINLHQKETTPFTARNLNAVATGAVVKLEEMVNTAMKPCTTRCIDEKLANGGETCNFVMLDQDVMPIGDNALVTYEPNSEHLGKLHTTIASKEKLMSQTALKVLLRRRDRLSHQQHKLEDEIARCDKNIQTILNGDEDDLALKIESILEFCNDACPQTRDRTYHHLEDQASPQHIKRKRLSEAILNIQKSCQELDGICYENNWILPTYRVSLLDGKSEATVSVKGVDFEISIVGKLCDSPREARESAAAGMLAKLQSMATEAAAAAGGRF